MNRSFLAIEATAFVLFGLCLWHALRIGRGRDARYQASWAPLAAMLGTVVFTFILEYILGDPDSAQSIYSYPGHFLVDPVRVPMWIPLGWAFVVYTAMQTSNKLEPSWKVRPVLDGLLALNLDFALDPIAAHKGWWSWSTVRFKMFERAQLERAAQNVDGNCLNQIGIQVLNPNLKVRAEEAPIVHQAPQASELDWIPADLVARTCRPDVEPGHSDIFGIPLRNFFAWFFIVASFSFAFRWLRHRWLRPRGRSGLAWELLAATLAILPAFGVILLYKLASEWIGDLEYAPTHGAIIFSLIWGAAILLVFGRWFTYRRDHPFDRLLWLAPLGLHAFLFFELFVRRGHLVMTELVVFMPTTAIAAVFLFGWPYLDDMKRIVVERGWWALFKPGAALPGRGAHG